MKETSRMMARSSLGGEASIQIGVPTLFSFPPQDNAAVFPIIESYLLLGAATALTPLSSAIQVGWSKISGIKFSTCVVLNVLRGSVLHHVYTQHNDYPCCRGSPSLESTVAATLRPLWRRP